MVSRPILGITMGDPASIGPEISVKALMNSDLYKRCRPLIIGDAEVMRKAVTIVGKEGQIEIHAIKAVKDALFQPGIIDVYDMDMVDLDKLEIGKVSVLGGETAFRCVKKVIEMAMNNEIDATVTNALNKEAINLAGYHFSGHTEIYAHYTNTKSYAMMLAHENLRVIHVSTHVSLREACDRVKKNRVLEVIHLADQACKMIGIKKPKIGVAGLNPHCGENGLFGREEIEEITPAIESACQEGIDVSGPIAPDTVFSKARGGWYDIVVVMYHDQGHIPLKVVGFEYDQEKKKWNAVAGVNLTMGLPIIRVSVDHGTAFEHAGKGTANELSLINSIDCAITLANNRNK
jgi:4-phospho-D-threonate 3-dehydrogenase / 4-phospho-D-erythronate 3-dehydrogenase